MAVIQANGLKFYYEIHGQGPQTLLLLAGLTRDSRCWQWVLPELSKHFRVVCLDNRCAGQSDQPDEPFTIANMAEDVYQVMQALDIAHAHVLGHSMGGFIAQQLAVTHPEVIDKLILVGTDKGLDSEEAQVYLQERIDFLRSGREISEAEVASLKKWLYAQAFLDDAARVQKIAEWDAENPHPQPRFATLRQVEACMAFHLGEQVNGISHPALVIHGEEDRIFPVADGQALAKNLDAECIVLNDVGHMVPLEAAQSLSQAVLDFIR